MGLLLCGPFITAEADPGADSTANRDTLDLPSAQAQGRPPVSVPADVHGIEGDALQRFASLDDAVNSLPGFHVREEGGLGGYSELSFRGSDAASVEIDLDGMRLNQEGEEAPDLGKMPLLWFSGLEERSGFDAFGAGSPGALARIDLSTAPDSSGHAELRGRVGSFSTAEGAATVHGGEKWKWTVGVEGQTAKNDFPFYNNNGTDYYAGDDAEQNLANNAYWSRGARAALQHDGSFWDESWSVLWLNYFKEYPGIPDYVFSDPEAYTRYNQWMGAWRVEAFPGHSKWEADVQAKRLNDAYADPGQSLGNLSYQEARTATSVALNARADLPLNPKFDLTPEIRLSDESVDPTATPYNQPLPSPTATRQDAQWGVTLQEKITRDLSLSAEGSEEAIHFFANPVKAFPADTAHSATLDLTPLALRAGAAWRTFLGSFEALGRYEERAPSTAELMGDNNGIHPNTGLDPEKTWAASLMNEWKLSGLQLQTTAFWQRYENPIRLGAEGGSAFLQYENGSDYRAVGVEEDSRLETRDVESRVSLTVQSIQILEGLGAGFWPAYQSPVEGHAEAFWKPRVPLAAVTLGPVVDFLGPYYNEDVNAVPGTHVDPEWEWGAHFSAKRSCMNLAFDARNIFNRTYSDFAYSVRSGRSFSLSVSVDL